MLLNFQAVQAINASHNPANCDDDTKVWILGAFKPFSVYTHLLAKTQPISGLISTCIQKIHTLNLVEIIYFLKSKTDLHCMKSRYKKRVITLGTGGIPGEFHSSYV